jgi:hypothetical protein
VNFNKSDVGGNANVFVMEPVSESPHYLKSGQYMNLGDGGTWSGTYTVSEGVSRTSSVTGAP